MMALLGSTATRTAGTPPVRSLLTLTTSGSLARAASMASLACLMASGESPLTTMLRPPPPPKLCPGPTAMSNPSAVAGSRAVSSSLVLASRSVVGTRRTVIWALLPERPWNAAWSVWAPVSASPGMLVWTSFTSGSAMSSVSTCSVRASTASEDAPAGGDTVTARIASLPVSRNWVGMLGDERQ